MKTHSIIIAQVGKAGYFDTKYVEGNMLPSLTEEGTESKYSFEAVINKALSENPDKMDLILIATKDSYLGSLYNVLSNAPSNDDSNKDESLVNNVTDIPGITDKDIVNEGDRKISVPGIVKEEIISGYEGGLSKNIYNHFPNIKEDIPFGVKLAIIDYGINNEELGNNFKIIQDVVNKVIGNKEGIQSENGEKLDIYFDISNGFRSFPFYIYALTNYLQKIEGNKGDKLSYHMYYGMFEAKNLYSDQNGKQIAPLVDLQVIDDLLQLINAVNEFQNCGSVKQILEMLKDHKEWDIKIGDNDKETLSYAFEQFDYGTNANNLTNIERGIDLLVRIVEGDEDTLNNLNDAERMLITNIASDFSFRFSRSDKKYPYSNLVVNLAKWYHDTGREGNAAIAIQELITTYLIERFPEEIKKYLLDKKFIDPKDKKLKRIPDDIDLRDKQYLFNPNVQDPIIDLLQNLGNSSENSITRLYDNYKNIKEKVRNIAAHIILSSEQGENDYKDYRVWIEEQINYMLREISQAENADNDGGAHDESDGRKILDALFPEEERNKLSDKRSMRTKKNCLQNLNLDSSNENGDFDDNDERFYQNYNNLLRQIKIMKDISDRYEDEDERWNEFQKEQPNLSLLFKCVDKWIRTEKNNSLPTDEYRRDYFTNLDSKGYEKFIMYINNHYNDIYNDFN